MAIRSADPPGLLGVLGLFGAGAPLPLLWCTLCAPFPVAGQPLRGFTEPRERAQRALEAALDQQLDPARIESHLRALTAEPHPAGSAGARAVAAYLEQRLRSYGLRVTTPRYLAYLPSPVAAALELIAPVAEVLPTTEAVVPGDPFTDRAHEHPGWMGYSPSGSATGEVVYGHHGSAADLEALAARGIELRGKVLLLRHYGTGSGSKARNAQRAGAAAILLYADPEDDGHPFGDVYPRGNWRPPDAIMRRTANGLPWDGDPLSPLVASLPEAQRKRPDQVDLPRIPLLPISARSAQRLLELLGGPVAEPEGQGALPLTYRLGPGPATVRLRVENTIGDGTLHNVVAWLDGAERQGEWVLLGNHHDAWIYGAGDPSSGTAALLEVARALGELARAGHRPRRTLGFAFWDGEEHGLLGSTEWVEEHQTDLLRHAVAYFNMDSAVFNTERPLSVAAHPLLHAAFREAACDIPDPRTGRSLFAVWTELQNRFASTPSVDGWGEFFDPRQVLAAPWLFEQPSDDAAPFFHQLALPASDMYYGADYGMYHSLYENFHWMKTVVDPTFGYHRLMAQLIGRLGLRFANADLVPFDWANERRYWSWSLDALVETTRARGQAVPHEVELRAALLEWEAASDALEAAQEQALAVGAPSGWAAAAPLALVPRGFRRAAGRPGAPWERNLWSGSGFPVADPSGGTLPGLRFALDAGRPDQAGAEARVLVDAVRAHTSHLRALAGQLHPP